MKYSTKFITVSLGALLLVLSLVGPAAALNTMLSYTALPPIVSEPTRPNVLVLISNDHTGFYPGYNDLYNYDNTIDYWGYFDPAKEYDYKSGIFTPKGWMAGRYTTNTNYWSGNFLNWVTMSHADFLRKALTGGQRRNDATGGTTIVRGNVPANHAWKKRYSGTDINGLVPAAYASTSNFFANEGEVFDVLNSGGGSLTKNRPFKIVIDVCLPAMPEVNCTPYPAGNMKPEGLLQRYHDKMLFGLMSYSHALPDRGGVIRTPIRDISNEFSSVNGSDNSSADSMLTYIARYTDKGWDPLAEMMYDAVRYYKGNEGAQKAYCPSTQKDDNFFFFGCTATKPWVDPVQTWCQKNNIIIINDEYPSRDGEELPGSAFAAYTDTPATGANTPYEPDLVAITKKIGDNEGITGKKWGVGDIIGDMNSKCTGKVITNLGEARGICPAEPGSDGTFYLAALAYDAFVNDLRDDHDKKQSIRTYGIAFRASPGGYKIPKPPLNQMWLAGKYGNFDDKNGNLLPDLDSEWMKSPDTCNPADPNDIDCLPKGFFYAEGGSAIEDAILEVFEAILRRAASGTAVSILATSGQGEGNLVQAYYRPQISEGTRDIKWTGYLQSFWVDKYGNLREDTLQNGKLDEGEDKVIQYFLDADGISRIRIFEVSPTDPYPDTANDSFKVIEMDAVATVWEAGAVLADTPAADRTIKTFIDINNNGSIDAGELVDLNQANAAKIKPYLALQDDFTNLNLGKTEDIRTSNLIAFIRGNDPDIEPAKFIDPANMAVRERKLGGKVWKLGDIIAATPVSLAAPADRYDLIYGDRSYYEYYLKYRDRETMVYVGANDGMFHAFTSWRFDLDTHQFEKPTGAPASEVIGSELWSYVPQALLPHLKWLSRPDYTHVYYADLQPRIFDARIFNNDAIHPNGWGTIMIVGLNTGGGLIQVTGDFDYDGTNDDYREFTPSYMAFDVTNPRQPQLLWERSFDGLGFSKTIPTILRIGKGPQDGPGWDGILNPGDWYLVFGNGPDDGTISGVPNYEGETDSNGRIYIVDLKTGKPYSAIGQDWWAEVADEQAFFNTPVAFDRFLNFNVDAAYMATTMDADKTNNSGAPHDWQGSVYRILTWDSVSDTYYTDPTKWSLQKLFASPRAISAPGTLSSDHLNNTWVYFGTGRYHSRGFDSDETSTETEYLIGIKDPYFNPAYKILPPTYYENISLNKDLTTADLLDSSKYVILDTGKVLEYNGANYVNPTFCLKTECFFNDLLSEARSKDGWIRELPVGLTAEKSLNKPTLFGGLALYTTFSPKGDPCDYGGSSTLWALYYETGTAFKRAIFQSAGGEEEIDLGGGMKATKVADSFDIGSGTASAVGVHIGKQNEDASTPRYSLNDDGTFSLDPNGEYIKEDSPDAQTYRLETDGTYVPDPDGNYVQADDGTFHPKGYKKVPVVDYSQQSSGDLFWSRGDGGIGNEGANAALQVRSGIRAWAEGSEFR